MRKKNSKKEKKNKIIPLNQRHYADRKNTEFVENIDIDLKPIKRAMRQNLSIYIYSLFEFLLLQCRNLYFHFRTCGPFV